VHRRLNCSLRRQSRIRGGRDYRYRQVKRAKKAMRRGERGVDYVKADPLISVGKGHEKVFVQVFCVIVKSDYLGGGIRPFTGTVYAQLCYPQEEHGARR